MTIPSSSPVPTFPRSTERRMPARHAMRIRRTPGRPRTWTNGTAQAWRERPTIAHAFAGAAQNDPASIEALRKLVADPDQAGIVKGSAIAEMGRLGGAEVAADVKAAAENPDPLVRLGAARGGRQPAAGAPAGRHRQAAWRRDARGPGGRRQGARHHSVAGPPRRSTPRLRCRRRRSARLCSGQRRRRRGTEQLRPVPAGSAGARTKQKSRFRRAIVLDPSFSGARINLAELYRATGENEKSEQAYAEAIAISPDEPTSLRPRLVACSRQSDGGRDPGT